jgi:hypothetical protein
MARIRLGRLAFAAVSVVAVAVSPSSCRPRSHGSYPPVIVAPRPVFVPRPVYGYGYYRPYYGRGYGW